MKEYSFQETMLPGPPFAFGAALVFLALIVRCAGYFGFNSYVIMYLQYVFNYF